jgi:hypothetical protein
VITIAKTEGKVRIFRKRTTFETPSFTYKNEKLVHAEQMLN